MPRSHTVKDPSSAAVNRRRALGAAIREARGSMTQGDFGRALEGELAGPVPQTTISRWELGEVDISLEQARAIEATLQLRPGTLARQAGYLPR